ncbi:nitrate- and nitrite sensing domain-containing protein [Nocardiopsis sp. NPDC058789]|uniref:sensor histidine kinase n=1 Tax=Nocardiopsis sp. NPDC058789 TaxID=3346634 RepID=UPI003670D217
MPVEKRSSLRARMVSLVLIPSTALLALWAVLSTVLATDIRDLNATTAFIDEVGQPVVDVITHLQWERRATMAAATPGAARGTLDQLDAARDATDQSAHDLDQALSRYGRGDLPREVLALQGQLNLLDRHRTEVVDDLGPEVDPLEVAAQPYHRMIESGLEIWDAQVDRTDVALSPHLRSLASLLRSREYLSQQDAVLTHSVATGSFTSEAHTRFASAAGAQRHTWTQVESATGSQRSQDYTELNGSSQKRAVYSLQDIVIGNPGGPDTRVPVEPRSWSEATGDLDERLRAVERARMAQIVETGHAHARELLLGVLLVSVLALAVALASVVVAVTGSQRLGRRLQDLRTHTLHHARFRLPQVSARLRAGESVDVDAEAPRLRGGPRDELGQVAEAFDDAQRAAVVAAVEEAQVRAGVRNVFRNITRRTQSLVHRQLSLLDRLERTETDPQVLESLFRIDHFSTQMRRNAENLMLLSGDRPSRRGGGSVGLHEAVRAAASEIEDYARVRVLALPRVSLSGEAGSDLVRLVAELLENAASFSPPGTEVSVSGRTLEDGDCLVEVEDEGLGMTVGQLESANALLAEPPRFDLARMREDSQLGLFVVATIASRHGFVVELRASPYQGTRALVRLPERVLVARDGSTGPMRGVGVVGRGSGGDAVAGPGSGDALAGAEPVSPVSVTPNAGAPALDRRVRPGARDGGDQAGGDVPPVPSPATGGTYMGLPVRRRRRESPPPAPGVAEVGDDGGAVSRGAGATGGQRSLSEIRSMMSSFQAGTERGRAESSGAGLAEGAPKQGSRHGESAEG